MQEAQQGKSSVARFPIFHHTQAVMGGYDPRIYPSKTHKHYVFRRYLKTSTFTLLNLNLLTTSHALVACNGGWYSKHGCCADIAHTFRGEYLYYYLPKSQFMSLGKIKRYIHELSLVFPGKISVEGIQTPDSFIHPTGAVPGVWRATLSNTSNGVFTVPQAFTAAHKWLVVKVRITNNEAKQNLFYLQFLRAIYQHIGFTGFSTEFAKKGNFAGHHSSSVGSFMHYYVQPRLYFRLQRLFPRLTRIQLLFLSFTIHGRTISSTYFPYYMYQRGYRVFDIDKGVGGINMICNGTHSMVMVADPAKMSPINTIADIKVEKIMFPNPEAIGTGSTLCNATSNLLAYLVSEDTEEGYRKAIEIIAACLTDKSLFDAIK